MAGRLAVIGGVFHDAFRNRLLRRLELAYAMFYGAECAVWLALLVYAYGHGGASAASLMAVVQLVPCTVLAPLLGAAADRRRADRVLLAGYVFQALAMDSIAAAIFAGAPVWLAFTLAPVCCLAISVSRPAHAALLPAVVRTAEELTAANVLTGWAEGASGLFGPALAGVLLAVSGAALAVTATAALSLTAGLLVLGARGPEPAPAPGTLRAQLASNLRAAGSDRSTRVLLTLHVYYYCLIGALDLLCVILAISVLHLGGGGAGYLNAAVGAGLVLAASVTAFVVGRPRLSGTMMAGIFGSAVALAVLGLRPSVIGASVLLAAVGFGGSVFDVTGRTLLQRAVPSDAVAGVFSILEALMNAGMLLGVAVVRVATAAGGYRAALVRPAALGIVLGVVLWPRIRAIDGAAPVPQVEVSLLRRLPIFAPLPAPSLEGLARVLVAEHVAPGDVIMREGEAGDRYYAVADGTVSVTRNGQLLAELGRGDGFGEIALVHHVPRTATVTALTPTLVYGLDKEPFILAVTGHRAVEATAQAVASRRLRSQDEGPDDLTARSGGDV
jgi:MFS family permease